jgi:predicted DNA-binding transcriptional regulator AlpA
MSDQLPRLLNAKESANTVSLSLPAFWRGVASGRLPNPVYPQPRAPRWFDNELHQAVLATRMKPSEAKAARRTAKIQADAIAA